MGTTDVQAGNVTRPGARPGRGRRIGWVAAAVAAVLALVGGLVSVFLMITGNMPGDSMDSAWETPADSAAAEHGNGSWLVGDVLVRSRFDEVTGYGVRTGKQHWEYVLPGRSEICSTSTPEDSVLLLVHGENVTAAEADGEGCAGITALDLKTGKELWSGSRKASAKATAGVAAGTIGGPVNGTVAAGGGLAVVLDTWTDGLGEVVADGRKAIRAVDLRTGERRWTATVPKDCRPFDVGAAKRRVVAVLSCGKENRSELTAAVFDPATGSLLHNEPLDARRPVASFSSSSAVRTALLSIDPLVVSVRPAYDTEPGTDAFFSFGADGRRQSRIEISGEHGKIVADKPSKVAIDGEHLYAVADFGKSSTSSRVVAIDLTTGRLAWEADSGRGDTVALAVHDGKVTVLHQDRGSFTETLYVLDGATGEELDDRNFSVDIDRDDGWLAGLFDRDGLLIVSRYDTDGPGRPFAAYERW
ncbi:PQQ-binding-like beta-propeller repeat protein [Streptomyces sp. NPDC048560]|uniref:outer membrane protein assembly factor BamB family protein n=1 Tax=Streptomyces sp. NPDC048560 TaxID=3155488 RepID=UPI00343AC3D6